MARLARYLSGLEQHPDDLAGWGRDDEEQARQPLWQDQANGLDGDSDLITERPVLNAEQKCGRL
ncbi:hypothetical protein LTR70_010098 [Exophiala xenobiotica]|uniref:Uncharacterized protein n=1 Tax=Lithohypha guttulata TaxID=1690604 RepID=A0ABR0K8U3_9EURO|nr:hypothetical protein LTR24_006039 [Lithohypha guttulata]KAK5309662.1 hypothetical protein LTR70_010098 [Exophiala xenobiotica]